MMRLQPRPPERSSKSDSVKGNKSYKGECSTSHYDEPMIDAFDDHLVYDPLQIDKNVTSYDISPGPFINSLEHDHLYAMRADSRIHSFNHLPSLSEMVDDGLETLHVSSGVRLRDLKKYLADEYTNYDRQTLLDEVNRKIALGAVVQSKCPETKKSLSRYRLARLIEINRKGASSINTRLRNCINTKYAKIKVNRKVVSPISRLKNVPSLSSSYVYNKNVTEHITEAVPKKATYSSSLMKNLERMNEREICGHYPEKVKNIGTMSHGKSVQHFNISLQPGDDIHYSKLNVDLMVGRALRSSSQPNGLLLSEITKFLRSFYNVDTKKLLPTIVEYLEQGVVLGKFAKNGSRYRILEYLEQDVVLGKFARNGGRYREARNAKNSTSLNDAKINESVTQPSVSTEPGNFGKPIGSPYAVVKNQRASNLKDAEKPLANKILANACRGGADNSRYNIGAQSLDRNAAILKNAKVSESVTQLSAGIKHENFEDPLSLPYDTFENHHASDLKNVHKPLANKIIVNTCQGQANHSERNMQSSIGNPMLFDAHQSAMQPSVSAKHESLEDSILIPYIAVENPRASNLSDAQKPSTNNILANPIIGYPVFIMVKMESKAENNSSNPMLTSEGFPAVRNVSKDSEIVDSMVLDAINSLNSQDGALLSEIEKFMALKYKVSTAKLLPKIMQYLNFGVAVGAFRKVGKRYRRAFHTSDDDQAEEDRRMKEMIENLRRGASISVPCTVADTISRNVPSPSDVNRIVDVCEQQPIPQPDEEDTDDPKLLKRPCDRKYSNPRTLAKSASEVITDSEIIINDANVVSIALPVTKTDYSEPSIAVKQTSEIDCSNEQPIDLDDEAAVDSISRTSDNSTETGQASILEGNNPNLRVSNKSPYRQCTYCRYTCANHETLNRHVKLRHQSPEQKTEALLQSIFDSKTRESMALGNLKIECHICSFDLRLGASHCGGCMSPLQDIIQICDFCGLICNDRLDFGKHVEFRHRPLNRPAGESSSQDHPPAKILAKILDGVAKRGYYNCHICGVRTFCKTSFLLHLVKKHMSSLDVPLLQREEREVEEKETVKNYENSVNSVVCYYCYRCDLCGYICNRTDLILCHTTKIHFLKENERRYQEVVKSGRMSGLCEICGKLTSINYLKDHRLKTHVHPFDYSFHARVKIENGVDAMAQTDNLSLSESDVISGEMTNLSKKKGKPKSTIGPILCHICGKVVKRIERHIWNHKAATHECPICKKVFNRLSNMITHKRVHTREKPFQCDICKMIFGYKCSVKAHIENVHLET